MSGDNERHSEGPYLTAEQAAQRLKVKKSTLEKWRILGSGPAYRDHGVIVYHVDELDDWSSNRQRSKTSGKRRGTVDHTEREADD
jgi:excisionase family DNA binding protein